MCNVSNNVSKWVSKYVECVERETEFVCKSASACESVNKQWTEVGYSGRWIKCDNLCDVSMIEWICEDCSRI